MKKILPYVVVALVTALMLSKPAITVSSAKASLLLCADIVIPSLFPFLCVQDFWYIQGYAVILQDF